MRSISVRLWSFFVLVAMCDAGRVIVTFFNQTLNEDAAVPEHATVVKRYGRRLVLDTMHTEEELYTLFDNDTIVRIEPDLVAVSSAFELRGWNLNESEPYGLHIEALRNRTGGSATVAVLDSGLPSVAQAYFKPDAGYSFVTMEQEARSSDFTDRGGCLTSTWHGTQVLSILDAVAPASTKVVLRVLTSCGAGFASDVADAVVWAAGGQINGLHLNPNPARVISMSFSGEGSCPSYLQSAVTQALGLGAILVAAAGNDAKDARAYFPGNCQGVRAVGAVTRTGVLANYSNYGPLLAFGAPGGDASDSIQVLSLSHDGLHLEYATAMGTSMAAPHVAGVYALLSASDMQGADLSAYLPMTHGFGGEGVGYSAGGHNGSMVFQSDVGPVGIRSGGDVDLNCNPVCQNSDKSLPCNEICLRTGPCPRYIKTVSLGYGSYVAQLLIYCDDGSNIVFYRGSWGGNQLSLDNIFELGAVSMTVTYNKNAICGFSLLDAKTGASRAFAQSSCSDTVYTNILTCGAGQKIKGLTGYAKAGDAVFTLGINCGVSPCNGQEYSSSYCSCPDAGTYQSGVNCVSCSGGSCGVGQYLSGCGGTTGGTCNDCSNAASGYYYTSNGGLSNNCGTAPCSACSAGKTLSGCTRTSPGSCSNCAGINPGSYFSTAGSCASSMCEPKTYSTGTASTACTPCPANSYSFAGASACICNAGYYLSGASCLACPPNSHSTAGDSACTCNAGYYKDAGGVCLVCPAGSSCLSNAKVACAAGTFSPQGASACTPCAAGYFSGAASASECQQCAAGRYSGSGSSVCAQCGAGKYSTVVGAQDASVCAACDPGSYVSISGATACTQCSPGTASGATGLSVPCSGCQPNYYASSAGLTACTVCSTRSCGMGFGPSQCTPVVDSVCVPCNPIARCTYLTAGQCVKADASPACTCDPGYEMVSGFCQLCATGKFKARADYSSCVPWTVSLCAQQGTYFVPGSPFNNSACLECPDLPSNAVRAAGGCSWGCEPGFDNNQPV